MAPGNLNPARLRPGTRVGSWRVLERRGLGVYGAVYLAIRADGLPGFVALKMALHPRDERFAREAELLSRIHHSNVPRLIGHGEWQDAAGTVYPFLAMEWVEGLPLYDWAEEQRPTSRQVLACLASLARALEATHAAGGVHRDVKGGNIVVRDGDGRVFLTDFGSGHYVGAATITWPPFPPGTPAYRSPEAWRTVLRPGPDPSVPYAPGPADDLFALGVTAYRLVTGEYSPMLGLAGEGARLWRPEGTTHLAPRVLNGRCCVELDALVSRMLSVHPDTRDSASELAEALEAAAREAGPEADVPLFAAEEARPVDVSASSRRIPLRRRGKRRKRWDFAAAAGVPLVALGITWLLSALLGDVSISAKRDTRDGGTVAVGDSALTEPESTAPPSALVSIALDVPPRPVPGQRRTDSNGRCPIKAQVPIQGYCWLKQTLDRKGCDENGYLYKDGECYAPVFQTARPATSGPKD
ncbi:serine/threonine protein kinase [Pyxidicoccus parkwayensis]|uniref:non-specific serine/threonine protein kinase n=1 Tax=Pyxidicoccus parkwayensis TaxID=2813578 RepID=A0ABX7P2C5_9BACT|nr:serine/threonine-protein kinase [Pyxidicoccus parkwaysis]QSQ23258.1 serine/threonine protein kinase [Pyxidicoccus parkwaysis]